ncbi:hypothetical protein METUNv1_02970 [Methyloversatilis universalis FAM5]|jgi:hypothetical protein|uniref:Uncharacterized protein n=1 Tax=Methyloversatilis universalis (strain ATCC BAA-1314 / DSM 25237 / JCM 13912 / CCUG 52030 / FAM5) TaxID=1000565 RepID=F5RF93_METUF|nr:hypothetical protein [Methyloversatilis universalis]EGK70749.1 hypothetical protein METUNv1_02970 [Methyloversatilis universalis FAM5]
MLPTEEACFRAVLRACQDHADAMLACGTPPRPTALVTRLDQGRIVDAALARMDMLDEASVVRFVQETITDPEVDVIGLSCVLRLAEFDDDAPTAAPVTRDVVVIYLVSRERETWVANDIDRAARRLVRGTLDMSRGSNTFIATPALMH